MVVRLVHVTRVISKNFLSDFIQKMVNIVGGRLIAYEKMIDKEINSAYDELFSKHPTVFNASIRVQEFTQSAMLIIVYGSIVEEKNE